MLSFSSFTKSVFGLGIVLFSGIVHSEKLEFTDICARMEITAEVFVFDKDGRLIEKKGEFERSSYDKPWSAIKATNECKIESNWTSVWDKSQLPLSIKYTLEAKAGNILELTIRQFDKFGSNDRQAALKEKTFRVDTMLPVMWESVVHKDQKVVVRFTPNISSRHKPENIDKVQISAKEMMISDQTGAMWVDNFSIRGHYVSIQTHKGSVALSYYPFPGATIIGEAKGLNMNIQSDSGLRLKLTSQVPFLPEGMTANIYGLFSAKTSERTGSVHSSSSNTVDEFMKSLKERF